jgi:hypothetical protein
MVAYQFHSWPSGPKGKSTPTVELEAESRLHGAALALRQFSELGCDITVPIAHLDMTDMVDGVKHTMLVEEVLDWLGEPRQAGFVRRERLETLLQSSSESPKPDA